MAAKVTLRAVQVAHDHYASEAARWGDDNLATVRALVIYQDLRRAWEAQSGRTYTRTKAR